MVAGLWIEIGQFTLETMWLDRIGSLGEIGFYALADRMREIGLPLSGWDGWTEWDGVGMGVPAILGTR